MKKFKIIKISVEPQDAVLISRTNNKNIAMQARFRLVKGQKEVPVTQVVKVEGIVQEGEIGLSKSLMKKLVAKEGEEVTLHPQSRVISPSYSLVKQRITQPGRLFTQTEIDQIINDIIIGNASPLESSVFLTSQLFQEWSLTEVEYLTKSLAASGQMIDWGEGNIFDKHSLGGVPGNKVSLLIVPIIAAAGLTIPKTSSRAITSPSGTADTMEAFGCDIEFTIDEIVEIAQRTGGLIAWTGGLNIVPADEKLIREVQFPLGIDPEPMMMASVLSKKVAMGINFLCLDIPCGSATKVETMEGAKRLAHRFSELGQRLGIRIESGITYGSSPVGHTVGPGLEAREALAALIEPLKASDSLIGKSTSLAGILLEMSGKAIQGRGQDFASELLQSGKAYAKFQEILEAQNADPNIRPDDIEIGKCVYEYIAPQNGWVVEINNEVIARAARAAGAPMDKRAGVYFLKKKDSVKRGEVIFRLHAPTDKKLLAAEAELAKEVPIVIEGMLLGRE
ncbi:MAG: thymidine phosphorylase [Candidatus Heimdallarchaeota archaeon]|nr:MAG: thymidine phosphorylase [Candidatus Heimdallarchaeota archaeon]